MHNNYLTLPVLFVMPSGHFPTTYGDSRAWLVLVLVFAAGALVRHVFNLRNAGRPALWPLAPATAFLGAAMYVAAPAPMPPAAATAGAHTAPTRGSPEMGRLTTHVPLLVSPWDYTTYRGS